VATSYTRSSVTVSIYGTDQGYDVTYVQSAWRDIKPFSVNETEDPELPEGMRVVEDGGVDGRSITVTRIITKDGVEVKRDTFISRYSPKTEYVIVGTMPVESEEETVTVVP